MQPPFEYSKDDRVTPDLLEITHDSVICWDLEGRISQWNQASQALYGWSKQDAIGSDAHGLLRSRYPIERTQLEQVLVDSGRWEGEVLRETASGLQVAIDARWVLYRDVEGRPAQIIETGRDITARKQVDEELRRSEYRYRSLFKAMAASFWEMDFSDVGTMLRDLAATGVKDLSGYMSSHPEFIRQAMQATRVLDVNDKTVMMFGATDKREMLTSVEGFWPEASWHVFAESLIAAVEKRPHYESETTLNTLDGRQIDVLFTVCWPPEAKGKGTLLLGLIDMTERKRALRELERSEYRYRNLFQAMAVSFWELDFSRVYELFDDLRQSGVTSLAEYLVEDPAFIERAHAALRVVDVNEKTLQLFGASYKEELLGNASRFWPTNSRAYADALINRFDGTSTFEAETRLLTLDGREIDVLFTSCAPVDSRQTGAVLVGIIDITERLAARQALVRMQAELAHAGRLSTLGELTASIAHEINQPLAAIATNGEAGLRWLSHEHPDRDELRALTSRVVADAHRAADIIARIRGMATKRVLERQTLSINDLVDETLQFLKHEMISARVKLKLQLSSEVPTVRADRILLQQVLVNLVMNAIHALSANAEGGSLISIETRRLGSETVGIDIKDNGPGIAPQFRGRVFESFFTTKPDGMGMGLAVCRSILDELGGLLVLDESHLGGCCFSIRLPSAESAAS